MRLQEAMRSGKDFREAGDKLWWTAVEKDEMDGSLWGYSENFTRTITIRSFLSDDWEIKKDEEFNKYRTAASEGGKEPT